MERKSVSVHPFNREAELTKVSFPIVMLIIGGIGFLAFRGLDMSFPRQLVLVLVFLLPVSIWIGVTGSYRLWLRPAVEVDEDGLRYTDRRKTQFWRWDEFSDVRSLRPNYSQIGRYGLYRQNERVLILDDRFQRSVWLMNHVLQQLQKQRGYQQALERNETLHLGQLDIRRDGLQVNNEEIRWPELRAIWQKNHFTQLQLDRVQQKPIKLKIQGLPNAPLLVEFITLTVDNLKKSPVQTTWPANKPKPALLEAHLVKINTILPLVVALLGLGSGAVILVYGVINGLKYHLMDVNWFLQGIGALIVPAISLYVLITTGSELLENPRLVLDEASLHRYARSGETHWNWQDISEVNFVRVYRWFAKVSVGLALHDRDGERVLVLDNHYTETQQLGNAAQEAHANAQFPGWHDRFGHGERLTFGRLALDQSGLYVGNKNLPWETIGAFDVTNLGNETHLVIYDLRNKRLLAMSIFTVSNLHLLTRLLQEQLDNRKQAADAGGLGQPE